MTTLYDLSNVCWTLHVNSVIPKRSRKGFPGTCTRPARVSDGTGNGSAYLVHIPHYTIIPCTYCWPGNIHELRQRKHFFREFGLSKKALVILYRSIARATLHGPLFHCSLRICRSRARFSALCRCCCAWRQASSPRRLNFSSASLTRRHCLASSTSASYSGEISTT